MRLVQDFLERSAVLYPQKQALIVQDQLWTYAELELAANRLAQGLVERGLARGERVVLCLDNSDYLVIAIFAVLKAGGVIVPINPGTKPEHLAFVVKDAEASVLMIGPSAFGKASAQLGAILCLREVIIASQHIVTTDASAVQTVAGKRHLSWKQALATQSRVAAPSCIDIDLAALIYTSGSTGQPKGVMLTHRNILAAADSISSYLGMTDQDTILNVLPMSFDYGLYQLFLSFRQGGSLVLERSMAFPAAILPLIPRYKVTGLPVVPTLSAMLLGMDLERFDLSSLRFMTNTGAALPPEHIRLWRYRLPKLQIFSMYGLTECKRVAYLPPADVERKPKSVGVAIPNTEVFVVDADGTELPAYAVGELVVRGAHVMQGYWKSPELTAKKLRQGNLPGERCLFTGDLFYRDDEGYLYFAGRTDEILKTRGQKVSPLEIEAVLLKQSGVAEAAVVGVDHPVIGEAVVAYVSFFPDCSQHKSSLMRALRADLEAYKLPEDIWVESALPRNAHGKIDKHALKARAKDQYAGVWMAGFTDRCPS